MLISAAVPAAAASAAVATACQFRTDAPDRHVVVRGDTLWDIAGKFLQQPWCWPTVWDLNRDEIANPHWIYPDQVIWFDRAAGRLRLGNAADANRGDNIGAVRLSPAVRSTAIGAVPIAAIPSAAIEPFLTQPLVIDDALRNAPRIVATGDGHVFIGKGDKAFVRGDLGGVAAFQVYRPGRPLKDPDTGQVIAHEAQYLGTVSVLVDAGARGGDVHTVQVTATREEMGEGDRLRPVVPAPLQNYAPHAPLRPVAARVMAVHGGVSYAGRHQVVSINRGKLDGLDIGAVLHLYHAGRTVRDATAPTGWFGRAQQVKLPDEQVGSLFIFRVFDRVAYGLIMQATAPVVVGDAANSPE